MSEPQNTSLGIPPLKATSKLITSLQKQSSGSATGNLRNKCALKPGHSLMDWIRLGNSGCDLSGTKGACNPVSNAELKKHCTQNDAWIAIRGKVYNVTRYMDFHPGGPEELMRGVGKDATKLFDEVHAWVNYEQLLNKCLIGPLRSVVKIETSSLKSITESFRPISNVLVASKTIPTEVIPNFNWIQSRSNISLLFYTKQFCNPGLILKRNSDKNIVVRIFIETKCHSYDFELHKEVKWPPTTVKVASESGSIELNFEKSEIDIWQMYGTYSNLIVQQLEDYRNEFEIIEKQNFNHNSFALLLRGKNDVVFCVPIGYHITLSCSIEGSEIRRSYTPVPQKYCLLDNGSSQDLYFLLKTYDSGVLAKHINGLKIGSQLELSQPKGSLKLNMFLTHTSIALVAAGSGITAVLGLIDHLLARNNSKVQKLVLMLFNQKEEDIWCRAVLEDMSKTDDRIIIRHILSQPSEEWSGEKGRISPDLMLPLKDEASINHSTFACVCGPQAFNNLAETILKSAGFSETAMHFFNSA